ncbi:MAG: serine/threonine-protein kinase [Anaerolineaceae bacterium]|nr:serine/threonine-protein kinase [Anaerolineaceae bacterium]
MDGMIGRSLGKYQIVEPLGEGGMATVYKAFDPSLERYVAIKIIRAGNQIGSDFLIRFQREARALAKLDHPYILKVLDYGEENGVPYLVMPYVAHGTLKQYTRTRLPFEKAIEITIPIAEALSYAHKRKIIHRDIKPANILFGESGEPILSDFGIAKMLDAGEQTQLTVTGFGIGTPSYMAPEQWNGIADERTDIYALGIVLYELITGRCPFQADTPAAILIKQVQDPLPRPRTFTSDLPETVEALLFKALAKDPAMRFQTMLEFIQGMNAVLQGKTVSYALPTQVHIDPDATRIAGKPTTLSQPFKSVENEKPSKPKWLPLAIGGGALLVIGCLIVILVISLNNFDLFNRGEPTNVAEISTQSSTEQLVQNEQIQNTSESNLTQPLFTETEVIQVTSTPQSIDTIENLPNDIPVFIPNNGDITTTSVDGALMFSYTTNEDNSLVETFFSEEMINLNWELISTSEMSAQKMVMYAFDKDPRNVVIYVIADQNNRTFIQIMIADDGG